MKSVTEFWSVALNQGLQMRTALTAEGKTPEEIQTALGEKFKYEGDKLKYFTGAIEVAHQNPEKLSRVLVVSLADGETAPAKAVEIEGTHYIPEFQSAPRAVVTQKTEARGGQQKKKDRSGPKESPWGLTPEQKAAKKGGSKQPAKA
jgi:hypothetical protein